MKRKYFEDESYCWCYDIPTADGLGVCKGCRGYTTICYSCGRCLRCWYTSQVELYEKYDAKQQLNAVQNWNKFYQKRFTKNGS